jgi:serine/threonine protein kinase/NADH:ubiquinone oxidoreductase subunit 6 (subunit J)
MLKAEDSGNDVIAAVYMKLNSLNWPTELVIWEGRYLQSVTYVDKIAGLQWRAVVMVDATLSSNILLPSSALYPADAGIASIGLVVNIAALGALWHHRKSKLVQLGQPLMTAYVLLAGLLSSILCFCLLGQNTAELCFVRPFLFNLAFTLGVGTVLVKSWAANRQFSKGYSLEAVVGDSLIRLPQLMFFVGSLVAVDLIILVVTIYGVGGHDGVGTSPTTTVQVADNIYTAVNQCRYHSNNSLSYSEIVFKIILIIGSCVFCYLNRSFTGGIAASKSLMVIVYNIAVVSLIVLIVRNVLTDEADVISIEIAGISVCVAVNAVILISPSIYLLHTVGDEGATADVYASVKRSATLAKLVTLPLHFAIVHKAPAEHVLEILEECPNTVYEKIEGKSAFDFALESSSSEKVITALIRLCLPFGVDKTPVDDKLHGFAWASLTQSDQYAGVVRLIMDEYSHLCFLLANARDASNRIVVNIASPTCRDIISKATFFMKRYQVTTSLTAPHYKSATTMVHMAVDHDDKSAEGKNNKVVLKFMVNNLDYEREISSRHEGCFESAYVMSVCSQYDSSMGGEKDSVRAEFKKHGFGKYRYCLVMPAGNRNLSEVLASENSFDKNDFLKFSSLQLMKALHHIHSRQFIHGDVKPQNIIRYHDNWVLTDFDSSASIVAGYSGFKLRSAYAPPELVHIDGASGKPMLKSVVMNSKGIDLKVGLPYELVPASASHDCWSLGVVLFRMASGEPLFLASGQDNIDNSQLLLLGNGETEWLDAKLEKIEDPLARNMVSQLLTVDPHNRPSMAQLMLHPFITGNTVARLIGQQADFDVFLSYRVASDSQHAQLLFDILTRKGLKVWWDKVCLEPGEDW